ncbi:MAG: hypothetical protein V2I25_14115 [Woeseiaceae bacterium]|jgi:Flp pilus assembly protein protease CpaA|nr:hypothetical protein [Woeseiaceae bacterium]
MHRISTFSIAPLGVTLSFLCSGIAISVALYVAGRLGAADIAVSASVSGLGAALAIVGYCVFAGLMVDTIRLAAALLWRKKPKHRLKLRKIIEANLA